MTMAKKDFVQGFYPEFQLEKLVSKDDQRPILNYIYFAHGYAYATDAHVGAKMRLTDICNFEEMDLPKLEGKFITAKTYEQLRKCKHVIITDEGFLVHDAQNPCLLSFVKETEDWHYPNFDKIIDEAKEMKGKEPVVEIGLRSDLLYRLGKAFGSHRLWYEFGTARNTILVYRGEQREYGFTGIIMPFVG